MKVDKRKPAHWLYMSLFAANVIGAITWRAFRRRRAKKNVVLYGHKLTGNLLALYRDLSAPGQDDIHVVFLTLDPAYYPQLQKAGVSSVLATTVQCMRLLSQADAVISDHGLHAMSPMLALTDVEFIDVWHGVPFKGFDARDFRVQQRYDEIWVASPLLKTIYVEKYGFDAAKVHATGYARTDRLVRRDEDTDAIKRRLGLDGADVGKIVLFAPTWKQDARKRSIYPFGVDEHTFFRSLSELAQRTGSTFVMRAHLNSGEGTSDTWDRIVQRPHARFPDTEELLLVSDILVCDWSSIAFDYLLLQRPTIFLDVEAPFAKGFSLGPEYRFGPIVPDMNALMQQLERCLEQPSAWQAQGSERVAQIRRDVYADYADGAATARCIARLRQRLGQPQG